MYTIKGHRRTVAITGAGVIGLLAAFAVCLLASAVVLAAFGPLPAIVTAAVASALWYVVGIPHTGGPMLAMSRAAVFGLNGLVAFSAVLKLLWG